MFEFSVLTKKSVQSIINEQKLLSKLYSPFIVNMHYAFQDRETLYLVLDIMEGGDLRHHLSVKTFSELQSSKSVLKQSFLLLALFWDWIIFITIRSFIEISSHRILYLIVEDMWEWLTLELPVCWDLKTLLIQVELLVTCVSNFLHSSISYLQTKSLFCIWFFCSRSNCLWAHAWSGTFTNI